MWVLMSTKSNSVSKACGQTMVNNQQQATLQMQSLATKYINLAFMLLVFIFSFAISTANAQVYKCVVNGKTVYSDLRCAYNPDTVKINPNENMVSGDKSIAEGLPAWKKRGVNDKTEQSGKCSFSSYALGDSKGGVLAKEARDECYNNELLKAAGRNDEVSLEAYNLWKDHRMITKRAPVQIPQQRTMNCRPDFVGGFNCN